MRFLFSWAALLSITTHEAAAWGRPPSGGSPRQHGHAYAPSPYSAVSTTTTLSTRVSISTSTPYYPTTGSPTGTSAAPASSGTSTGQCSYWLEDIKHQGLAAFNPNSSSYQVFRNVKDFGAKGDGKTDDTNAINKAISDGARCVPGSCNSTTTTPALVYFPPGTYAVSSSIIDYYYTQLVGNPNCLPTIKALGNFSLPAETQYTGFVLDGDPYGSNGAAAYGSTNVFWRQVRNFIIDTTAIAPTGNVAAVHWPTGQATSLQNIIFNLSKGNGTNHAGVFIENGSGGFLGDLVFNGGLYGLNVGNQQFTSRNLTFNGARVAINQIWDWSWTYQNININNCGIGINMSSIQTMGLTVSSLTLLDSTITNTPIGILTAWSNSSYPLAGNAVILENVQLNSVAYPVKGAGNVTALGATNLITAWGEGQRYTPTGPTRFQGPITPNPRTAGLIDTTGKYYQRSKPQYEGLPLSSFVSARDQGAKGDGITDDTKALQAAINSAAGAGKVLFVDHGDYLVTKTIHVPEGARIVGEAYSVILSSGSFFNDINSPQPVVEIGAESASPGTGSVEWSDMIVSTQGQQQGAVLIQYNLASPATTPSGLWDVHTRIGGFAGSNLGLEQCPTTPDSTVTAAQVNTACIGAYLNLDITKYSGGLYLENVWLWTADHDVEDQLVTQITVYSGRGLLDRSITGPVWLVGTAVEHNTLYQYQFSGARNVFAGLIQTETPYYQPNPSAPLPFPRNAALDDPPFTLGATNTTSNGTVLPAADAWGLRVLDAQSLSFYGAGLYSFFNNYNNTCAQQGSFGACQSRIVSIADSSQIGLYNLNTVGVHYPITLDGVDIARYEDNVDNFVATIALFRTPT